MAVEFAGTRLLFAIKGGSGIVPDPFAQLERGRYACILADPPWAFRTYDARQVTPHRREEDHYLTMTFEQMAALPVADLAAKNCALFMWVIGTHIPDSIRLGEAWGFKFKTDVFYWMKMGSNHAQDDLFLGEPDARISMGYYSRKQVEPVYLFTRGKPKRLSKGVRQIIRAPKREHSRKPDEQYERIEALVGGPRLELFARTTREGWDSWGNQTDKFAPSDDGRASTGGGG